MAHAVRFHETGGPDVLRWEAVEVGDPGAGQVRLRHEAVGLNFADTYFRSGLYPVPLPAGIGVEAAGVVEAVGPGVTNVAVGDRVTYTGFLNTLGAYSTERLIPAAPLVKLPAGIACDTAAAMTMRGLTSAYLLRRIHAFAPGDLVRFAKRAGFSDVKVRGEELLANWFGWFNRALEASAHPDDVPMLWKRYAFDGYLALQRVDEWALEPRLPAAIFYNLLLSARRR